jgi:hypothetical protein
VNIIGIFLAILLTASTLLADTSAVIAPEADAAVAAPAPDITADPAPLHAEGTSVYTPLTLRESYAYTTAAIIGPSTLFRVATTAAIEQTENKPSGWAATPGGYALRAASAFGQIAVRENIAFGIRALDGEDPRYFRSGRGGFWQRTGYALGHTFAAVNSKGRLMPAWSMLAADYSAPFIARQWTPGQPPSTSRELAAGTLGVGVIVTQNLILEFWPDLQKAFRH